VKYELGFYIPEDDVLHTRRRENLKSYIDLETLLYMGSAIPGYRSCTLAVDLAAVYLTRMRRLTQL
jgi:hypothetical protein